MSKIDPVEFPIFGIADQLTVLILPFYVDASTCNTYWRLSNSETDQTVVEGNYELTEQEFADWGNDNTFLLNCVAAHLEVTILPDEEPAAAPPAPENTEPPLEEPQYPIDQGPDQPMIEQPPI